MIYDIKNAETFGEKIKILSLWIFTLLAEVGLFFIAAGAYYSCIIVNPHATTNDCIFVLISLLALILYCTRFMLDNLENYPKTRQEAQDPKLVTHTIIEEKDMTQYVVAYLETGNKHEFKNKLTSCGYEYIDLFGSALLVRKDALEQLKRKFPDDFRILPSTVSQPGVFEYDPSLNGLTEMVPGENPLYIDLNERPVYEEKPSSLHELVKMEEIEHFPEQYGY